MKMPMRTQMTRLIQKLMYERQSRCTRRPSAPTVTLAAGQAFVMLAPHRQHASLAPHPCPATRPWRRL